MKNTPVAIVLSVTCLFCVFLLGFYLGRNTASKAIYISAPVSDGPVYTQATSEETAETAETRADIAFPVNLNTATKEELMALPGIGEVLADSILAYRNSHGIFTAPEDLMEVSGISENRFEAVKDLITVGG